VEEVLEFEWGIVPGRSATGANSGTAQEVGKPLGIGKMQKGGINSLRYRRKAGDLRNRGFIT